tara:strand:- start:113 stop:499 length:387 start_codon:yes stop_codon:yes gene_type:complete
MKTTEKVNSLDAVKATVIKCSGEPANQMEDIASAIIEGLLVVWPVETATKLCRIETWKSGEEFFVLTKLISARAREYLEFHYGTSANVNIALELMLERLCSELALLWLEGATHRGVIKKAILQCKRSR